jgi:hypothetical protein
MVAQLISWRNKSYDHFLLLETFEISGGASLGQVPQKQFLKKLTWGYYLCCAIMCSFQRFEHESAQTRGQSKKYKNESHAFALAVSMILAIANTNIPSHGVCTLFL